MEPLWSPVVATDGKRWQMPRARTGRKTSQNRCRGLQPVAERSAWEEATVRPLVVVNALLEQAHSSVRVFTLYAGGNDGWALLMDPRVPAAMRVSGLFPDREVPSLPLADGRP